VDLTNEDVADVLALLDSLPYDSLDLETSRFRLTLRRTPGGWTEESQVLTEPAALARVPGTELGAATAGPASAGAGSADSVGAGAGSAGAGSAGAGSAGAGSAGGGGPVVADGLAAVTTPLPGTFYRAPRPGADPFVQVGDAVTAGTVVAIVETMKLMNPVHAGTAGRVARITLDNGEFVPLGTTLMLIEPV